MKVQNKVRRPRLLVGWREWLALPELGITHIKAKIDTGARTSALHAFAIKPYKMDGKHYIRFKIHPFQHRKDVVVECAAEVKDVRWVTDSGGHSERRYVIKTRVKLGGRLWPIEVTLTNRDPMHFRMLLGRTAMRRRIVVEPTVSYLMANAPKL